jgi:signal transduction histidine kinase/ABC-type amino acid transport substrate-binding protein
MKDRLLSYGLAIVAFCFLPLSLPAQPASTDDGAEKQNEGTLRSVRKYTTENPLVFEDAWDLWPFAYREGTGQDVGFNIDLVKALLDQLNIPYVIELKERNEVLEDLKSGKADLTFGMYAPYHDDYGHYGKSIVKLFTHSVVWPKGQPQRVFCEDDLQHERVIVHTGSFSHHLMISRGWGANAINNENTRNAILGVSQRQEGQMLWNTASLEWLIRTSHLENLEIAPVSMTECEYKFMSNDTLLLAQLDEAFKELQKDGCVEDLYRKWFFGDESEGKYPLWVWNILNAAVVAAIFLVLFVLFSLWREQKATEQGRHRAHQLAQLMYVSHLSIWLYDVVAECFIWLDKDGIARKRYTLEEFAGRLESKDHDLIMDTIRQMVEEGKLQPTVKVNTFAESNPSGGSRTYSITFSVLRYHNKKPTLLLAACNDVTEERRKQRETSKNLQHYQSVFNSNMIDMVYYDSNGYVANMNERAQRTLNLTLDEAKTGKVGLPNLLDILGLDLSNFEYYYSTLFNGDDFVGRSKADVKVFSPDFYELQLQPVRDAEGKLLCVYGSGRDCSEKVKTYRQTQQNIAKLKSAADVMTRYAQNMNYVMQVGGVRMVNYSPDTHLLTVFKGYGVVQYKLTQSRFMSLIDETCLKRAMREVNSMDDRSKDVVDVELKTTLCVKGIPLFLHVSLIGIPDNDGRITYYFGMIRDISDIRQAEHLLEKETVRAKEVEHLKNSFLRNMSYEIRTPLNVVVGFAELFEQPHTREDEELFIKEIKNNSSHLLQLINDILFLSRLDARMIEINKQFVDFALVFEFYCSQKWQGMETEGVNYVAENDYEHLIVEIDETNVRRVLEQIINNAIQHTQKGYVRARYDYMGGKLMIAVEDTGSGISAERLKSVFERFATSGSGTGLGLPICKELVEQMGGTIQIESEEDEGTTVWITLPCAVKTNIRKTIKRM